VPFSYAQYAGNGSATTFSVPFPYLLKAHVKLFYGYDLVSGASTSELVDGAGFTWTTGTQVQTTVAPAAGQTLTIIRQTPTSALAVQWQDGSNLVAEDLQDSSLQTLYAVQEQDDVVLLATAQSAAAATAATAATATAAAAQATANGIAGTANAASATANAASATANAASATANAASATASGIAGTANTALSNSSAAVAAANSASSNATAALSTANTASSNASTALSTANTASSNASTALSTANTASSNASAAVASATAAVTTANAADAKADQAIASVLTVVPFAAAANVAAIPASPANDDYVEVGDSTGIQSFTPLAGMPAGFIGDAGLSVRLRYTSAGATWNWLNYFTNNPEIRYAKLASPTLTGTPAAPTPAVDTDTTQLATTAYVVGQNYTKQTRTVFAGAGLTGGGDLSANRSIAANIATQEEAETGISVGGAKLMTPARVAQAMLKLPLGTVFVVGVSTVLATPTTNRPRVVVIAAGLTLDLPVSPSAGSEVSVTIAGNFTNTIIARNGQNIMSLAEDLTIDRADVTVTLLYVDATRGWRIV
jgi:hypothetical protein